MKLLCSVPISRDKLACIITLKKNKVLHKKRPLEIPEVQSFIEARLLQIQTRRRQQISSFSLRREGLTLTNDMLNLESFLHVVACLVGTSLPKLILLMTLYS